jgi:hypothetical protein
MSGINSIASNPVVYPPTTTAAKPGPSTAATQPGSAGPKTTTAGKDADHDGDTDGPGVDVKG